MTNNNQFTDNERNFIQLIREEAKQVKDCFTQYSFHALAGSVAAIGLIIAYQKDYPHASIACIPVIILLLCVARIGIHKYSTANRNHGFQLYLERIISINNNDNIEKNYVLRNIGWEEAMRAWRIVQATAYESIYNVRLLSFKFIKTEREKDQYPWYNPSRLIDKKAKWHPGTYLGNMLGILHVSIFLLMLPLYYYCFTNFKINVNFYSFFCAGLVVVFSFYVAFRIFKTNFRLKILEEGLLSIHSCSIMWHAVAVAHYRTLKKLQGQKNLQNYSKILSELAVDLAEDIVDIHSWIDDDDNVMKRVFENPEKQE